ncbi:MAG: regulatory iron-sulfur-containing complex subunit RicT [bacterium]
MATAVGVRVQKLGLIHFVDPKELELSVGESVVFETKHGLELGQVVNVKEQPNRTDDEQLMTVVRRAKQNDLSQATHFLEKELETHALCLSKIQHHALPMKLVKTDYNFNGTHVTFSFTAEGRVDFRELVKDLTQSLRTKVELRQIGPRDETKVVGGIGKCGRVLCCSSWMPKFKSISMDMAYNQYLGTKNPDKITGVCGRLLCCLSYEDEYYRDARKEYPEIGVKIKTKEGTGHVIDINIFREKIKVSIDGGAIVEVDKHDYELTS